MTAGCDLLGIPVSPEFLPYGIELEFLCYSRGASGANRRSRIDKRDAIVKKFRTIMERYGQSIYLQQQVDDGFSTAGKWRVEEEEEDNWEIVSPLLQPRDPPSLRLISNMTAEILVYPFGRLRGVFGSTDINVDGKAHLVYTVALQPCIQTEIVQCVCVWVISVSCIHCRA